MNEELIYNTLIDQSKLPAIMMTCVLKPEVVEIFPGNEEYVKLSNAKPVKGWRLEDEKLFPQDYSFPQRVSVIPYNALNKDEVGIDDFYIEPENDNIVTIIGIYNSDTKIPALDKTINQVITGDINVAFDPTQLCEVLDYCKKDFLESLNIAKVVRAYDDQTSANEEDLVARIYTKAIKEDRMVM